MTPKHTCALTTHGYVSTLTERFVSTLLQHQFEHTIFDKWAAQVSAAPCPLKFASQQRILDMECFCYGEVDGPEVQVVTVALSDWPASGFLQQRAGVS